MIILGVDPSTRFIGWAVYDTVSAHLGPSGETRLVGLDYLDRQGAAADEMRVRFLFCELCVGKVDVVALESPFVWRNRTTSLRLGALHDAVARVARAAHIRAMDVTPAEAKKAATSNGRADKRLVQRLICARFGLASVGEHQADAIAVALAAAGKLQVEALAERSKEP